MKNTSKKLAVGLLTTTIVASQVFPTSLSLFPEQTKGTEAEATTVYISPNPTVTDTGGSLQVNFNINVLSSDGYVRMEIFRPTNPDSPATSGGRILDTFEYISYPTYKGDYTVYLAKRVAAEKGDVVRITYYSKSGTQLGIAATNAFATGYLSASTTALINNAKSKVDALFTDTTKNAIKPTTNQAVIDAAQVEVDKLPDGTDKTNLQNDIDKAKTLLADKVANENIAQTAVNDLFTDASKNGIKPTTDQAAIDAAQALVNKVTDPAVKAIMQADVDKAQSLLDAKNVATAEKEKQDAAKKAVDELFNNNNPSSNVIKPLTDQATIDAAQKLVNAVTDPTTKAALQADVDKAQGLLDGRIQADKDQKVIASYLVNQLFQNNTPSSDAIKTTTDQAAIDNAQGEINKIVDPTVKAALQQNLDRAQELLDQRNTVVSEKAKQDAAKKAVDELFNNNTPSSNAIKPTTNQATIDAAQALVNKVTDPTTKAALQADVDKAASLLTNNANNTINSIDTYTAGTSYVTGKTSPGVTRVGLYVNGVLVKTASASNGSYQIYAGATPEMKVGGQIFEVATLTAGGVPGQKLTSMVAAKALSKLAAPVVDTFYVGDSNVTGTLPTGAIKVGLYVDGSLVRYGAITGNTFKIYSHDATKLRSAGQEFKVVVVDAAGQESDYTTSKVEVNNAKVTPDVNATTASYLKGNVTGNVARLALYIDGSLVRYGSVSGQTYSLYVNDVPALKQSGTEYELRALNDSGRVLYTTTEKTK
ncbi:toxin Cry1Ac domain D-VI-related protein [Listeria grandensis]|uniref:toxin Cry1Ac domain D-VI-related protein n=1 Tax=Listeria grandensis TaxID=1494963 RepID=UPI00164E25E9|nr:toxin Cry1Ac domain D-VI-related protein [Listeria grandensis]MBC6316979.1 hypothetical protein [Listeria grandensis]